jgi:hypothetical protein
MVPYLKEKRCEFKRCESLILLSTLKNAAETLPNRGGWIEIKSAKIMEIFGLSASEFRNATKELEEKGLIERSKFGKFPFIRLMNPEIFSEVQPQNDAKGTVYNTNNTLGIYISSLDTNINYNNIMSDQPQNEAENPKLVLLPQQKQEAIEADALPEFVDWWARWRSAHQNLPEKNECRKKSIAGLRNSSRAKAEKAYIKLRRKFERAEIFLATRYYLLNKRDALQQTAHAERFLSEDLISQFLNQVNDEKEEAQASEIATYEALNLNVGVYGT